MKLNKLRIQKFRNITDATLETNGSKFVVIRGANRNGKTSIAEALSLALTPTTWGLDGRGAGFARKIKRGENKATLEVELQGANRTLKRTVSLSVTSTGRSQSSEDVNDPEWHPAKFDKILEDKKNALGIAINTRAFQSMIYSGDEKAQKNLLAQLVLPAKYDFPKETIADVETVIGQGTISFDGEPFAVIEQAYKKLYKEREDVNRKIKEFVIPEPLQRPQGVDSESLTKELSSLRTARQALSVERDEAAKKINEASVKQARATAKVETLEASLRASKEALRLFDEAILPDANAFEVMAASKAKFDSLRAERQRLSGAQEYALKEFNRVSEMSNSVGSTCPTCEQEIDEAKVTKLAEVAIAERERLSQEYASVSQAITALGDVDGAIAKLAKHKEALAGKVDVLANIERQKAELATANAEASAKSGGLFETSGYDQKISNTDKAIESILGKMQPVIAAEEREKDISIKKEQLKRLEDKASKLDVLVKYFDKDGVKSQLIKEHIGGFEAKCNEVLSAWNYSCSLSIEPFKFEITDYRKVSTPLIDLSGAEELMFYAAFQCAVSRVAGIGFVVIDRIDTLLADLRPKLFQQLYKMVSENILDQVILLVADTSEQIPKLANSAFFMVEEGNIRRLG